MPLPTIFDSLSTFLQENLHNQILEMNTESAQYGLTLTATDAQELIEARHEVLQSFGRVELDIEVIRKLILSFCTSPFITQEDYATILLDLLEVFYYMKNETEDRLSDDQLIEQLKDFFDDDCGGSMELLMGRELEEFARSFRRSNLEKDYLLNSPRKGDDY